MTLFLILAILGVASAEFLGGHHGHPHEAHTTPNGPFTFDFEETDNYEETNTLKYRVNGIVTFDYHAIVIRDGEVTITGPHLEIGQTAPVEIDAGGFATTGEGERVSLNSGLVHVSALSIQDMYALQRVFSRIGISYSQFIQFTGTIPPQEGILELTSGVITINGVDTPVHAGLLIVVEVLDPNFEPSPYVEHEASHSVEPEYREPEPTYREPEPSYHVNPTPNYGGSGEDVTVLITEIMAHETVTVTQPAYVSKTKTNDYYITITSPYYVSDHVTHTQIDWLTETVAAPLVIKSTLPAGVVVVTTTSSTDIVLTVTNTATQFHVQTKVDTLTSTLQHTEKVFNFKTVTVLNPETSTVVKTITQTGVTTVYLTSTVDSTYYLTSTMSMTITAEPQTTPVGYY